MENKESVAEKSFKKLYDVINTLRSENGCPWDKKQTPLTMRQYLVEETFEAVDAISCDEKKQTDGAEYSSVANSLSEMQSEKKEHVKEELGDIIINALLILKMYEQYGDFTTAECLDGATEKLIRRHPHVFEESEGKVEEKEVVTSSAQVKNQWNRIKENVEGRKKNSILDEVPDGFPPLLKAYKMLKKSEDEGFVWSGKKAAMEKVNEEFSEVEEASGEVENAKSDGEKIKAQLHVEEECGDLFLALVTLCRILKVTPDIALSRANEKFYKRFTFVEKRMKENNIPFDKNNVQEMERFWKEGKDNYQL